MNKSTTQSTKGLGKDQRTALKFYSDYSAWGHGKSYYRRRGAFAYETFANLYAINGNAKAMDQARKLFPRTVKEFERMLKDINDE